MYGAGEATVRPARNGIHRWKLPKSGWPLDLGVGRTAKAISADQSQLRDPRRRYPQVLGLTAVAASWGTATPPTGTLHQRHRWTSAPGARRRPCPAAPHTPARSSTTIASSAGAMAVAVSLESANNMNNIFSHGCGGHIPRRGCEERRSRSVSHLRRAERREYEVLGTWRVWPVWATVTLQLGPVHPHRTST